MTTIAYPTGSIDSYSIVNDTNNAYNLSSGDTAITKPNKTVNYSASSWIGLTYHDSPGNTYTVGGSPNWNQFRGYYASTDCNCACACCCACSSCFLAGSSILMSDGHYKNIEDIKPGEFVRGAFGESNPIIALDIVYLGHRYMYEINGEHNTSDDHPHVSFDRKFYSCEPEAIIREWGNYFTCELADGSIENLLNRGISHNRIGLLQEGCILQTNQGPREVKTIKKFILPPETRLYNFVVGGSHTYTVDDYAVTGWPREDDFDYDKWEPKDIALTLEDYRK